MKPAKLAYFKIFPPIGIARVGNSESEYYIGPETNSPVADPDGGYKDAAGAVKRQAARFRIYGYSGDGRPLGEITANTAEIEWNVELANKKASWHQFTGANGVKQVLNNHKDQPGLRNRDFTAISGASRQHLIISPKPQSISGRKQSGTPMAGAIFAQPESIYLGELRTDESGRLLVLGGRGVSKTSVPDNPITHYANNDFWYDDTSDGPVTATVKIGGETLPMKGAAWVIVTPPTFSPHTQNIVTLYDVMEELALESGLNWAAQELGEKSNPKKVSFSKDILPILRRLDALQWVSEKALRGHGRGRAGEFVAPDALAKLATIKDADGARMRAKIVARLRDPHLLEEFARKYYEDENAEPGEELTRQSSFYYMPPLSGDEGDVEQGVPLAWLALTRLQYDKMVKWSKGEFIEDFAGNSSSPSGSRVHPDDPAVQTATLTRAALEACTGGAFFPGIEMTSIARYPKYFSEAFRLDVGTLTAGDITKWMALPWQADFYECRDHWWPSQRPDDTIPEEVYFNATEQFDDDEAQMKLASALTARQRWERGVGVDFVDRPVGLPLAHKDDDAATYAARARSELLAFINRWLRFGRLLPQFSPSVAPGRFKFLLLETLRSMGVDKWDYQLPGGAIDEKYRKKVLDSLADYIDSHVSVPEAETDQTLDAYRSRLKQEIDGNAVMQTALEAKYVRLHDTAGDNEMVRKWSSLAFIAKRTTSAGEDVFVESGRGRYEGLKDRDYFHIILNLDSYRDFLPTARKLADKILADSLAQQRTADFTSNMPQYSLFDYSTDAFNSRLEEIYSALRRDAETFDPSTDARFTSRERMVYRTLQLSPFNLTDGAWLRFVADAGPIDEVRSYLFDIWSDESGGGDPSLNHANIYTDLLHSLGIYLPPIESRLFADHPGLLDSAFSNALFQLVISQFSHEYLPEILGMTLYLEWEVLGLYTPIKLLEYFGINSHFYRMHVGIDNATNGHGALAKKAVQVYLDNVARESGEQEMQQHWRRIWNGYVTFGTYGKLGEDMTYYFDHPPSLDDQMVDLINRKKHFAQFNHGAKMLGNNLINDWFDDPRGFLRVIAESHLVNPEDPDKSVIFQLTGFNGPMYKIFTPAELKLWRDWIGSLRTEAPPDPNPNTDPGHAMAALIDRLRPVAVNVPSHQEIKLFGDLNNNPDELSAKPLTWWLRNVSSYELMAVLANRANPWIVPGDAIRSPLVAQMLSGGNPMSKMFDNVFPGMGGRTGKRVVVEWINARCPIPELAEKKRAPAAVTALTLRAMAAPTVEKQPPAPKRIYGQGHVH